MARYSMFLQVYLHVRRIYDKHLVAYLKKKYKSFPVTSISEYIKFTEPKVIADITADAFNAEDTDLQKLAERIYRRKHFKAIDVDFKDVSFFKETAIPRIKSDFSAHFSGDSADTDEIIVDVPEKPFSFYKDIDLGKIMVFQKGKRDLSNCRTILEESDLLAGMKPIINCRVYTSRDISPDVRQQLEAVCLGLKKQEIVLQEERREKSRMSGGQS